MSAEDDPLHTSDAGQVIRAAANRPIRLSDPDAVWIVEAGAVDVFVVRFAEDDSPDRRLHLVRLEQGALLFGVATGRDSALVACGRPSTRLRTMGRSRAQALLLSRDGAPLATGLEDWVSGLGRAVAPEAAPRDTQAVLVPGSEYRFEGGESFEPSKGLLWVRIEEGRAHLFGRTDCSVAKAADFIPIGTGTWLTAAGPLRVLPMLTRQWAAEDPEWRALDAFNTSVLRAALAKVALRAQREREQLRQRSEADRQRLRRSVRELASVMDARVNEDGGNGKDPLLTACRVLGSAVGIDIQDPPAGLPGGPRTKALESILAASRVRSRVVTLEGQWWRRCGLPLLGFLEEDGRPVAVVPKAPGRYVLTDPTSGETRRIDAAVAGRLESEAVQLYPALPSRPVGALDLVKLGTRGSWRDMAWLGIVGALGGLLSLAMPIATGMVLGRIVPQAEMGQLLQIFLALVAAALAAAGFQLTRSIAMLRLSGRAGADLQSAVWDRLLRLPVAFFRRFSAGDLGMRATSVMRFQRTLSGSVATVLLAAAFSVFSLALLFYYCPVLALAAAGLVSVVLVATAALSLLFLRYGRRRAAARGKLTGTVLQLLSGVAKLRVSGTELRAFAHWARQVVEERRLTHRSHSIRAGLDALSVSAPLAVTIVVLFLLTRPSIGGGIGTAQFLAFYAARGQLLAAVTSLASVATDVLKAVPDYERCKVILTATPEFDETKQDSGPLSGEIEASHLSFRYSAQGPPVLDDVSISAAPGEFVALVGPSGSGKSTLLRMMLGFDSPESGAVLFDGQELSRLDVRSVRRQTGVVLQNGAVMAGTLLENIVGGTGATEDDAWEAARMAGLAEDIEDMAMGMYTVLTQGGGTLSGGQAQRLLIARALVTKPAILFFDEATSALDNRTQAHVSQSLDSLRVTRVVVAHRLSTIANADKIVVLVDGRVSQQGTYAELMDQDTGVFAQMARRQIA